MSERDYRNYFGQTGQPLVLLSEFELTPILLRIVFDGFGSIEQFDAGDEPLPNLRREFFIDGTKFEILKEENPDIFESVKVNCLKIANVPKEYQFTYLNLLIIRSVLVIHAISSSADDSIIRTKTAPEYHQIIADNMELIIQVLTVAWQYGKENDPWLNNLISVSESIKR